MCGRKTSWRLLLLAALMPLMGSAYVSCSFNSPHTHVTPTLSFSTELDLQDTEGTSRRRYAVGEDIHMILTVRNRSSLSAQVEFPTLRTYDFIVVLEGTNAVIWQ